ncbi:hypothetical protein GmHk_11G033026 [Glycine max]|nr:hypothetical protein GmHk_11G033026 [Glycine max]
MSPIDGHTVCKVGTLDVGAGVGALVGGGGGARLAHKVVIKLFVRLFLSFWIVLLIITKNLRFPFEIECNDSCGQFALIIELALPLEPEVGPSAVRVNTKESCVDPSTTDPDMGDSDKCGLYIEENHSRLVALGKVYEGSTAVHNIPLLHGQVKDGVEEVKDADAPVPVPTDEFFLKPLQVMWDATVFGVFNEDFPLYIKHEDLSEIAHGGQCLNIFVIQLWILHLTETSMRTGNSDVYGFLEPQSIQRSGQSQFESKRYMKSWMQNSKRDVYLGAYLNGKDPQGMYPPLFSLNNLVDVSSTRTDPQEMYPLLFSINNPSRCTLYLYHKGCTLQCVKTKFSGGKREESKEFSDYVVLNSLTREKGDTKEFKRALKGLDDTPQPKSKAGARWIVVKCNRQKGSIECGYYVMHWMSTIILGSFRNNWKMYFNDIRPLEVERLKALRIQWTQYYLKIRNQT